MQGAAYRPGITHTSLDTNKNNQTLLIVARDHTQTHKGYYSYLYTKILINVFVTVEALYDDKLKIDILPKIELSVCFENRIDMISGHLPLAYLDEEATNLYAANYGLCITYSL